MGAKYKYKHEAEWKSDRDVSYKTGRNVSTEPSEKLQCLTKKINQVNKNRENIYMINTIEEIVVLKANKIMQKCLEKRHIHLRQKERKAWLNPDICD